MLLNQFYSPIQQTTRVKRLRRLNAAETTLFAQELVRLSLRELKALSSYLKLTILKMKTDARLLSNRNAVTPLANILAAEPQVIHANILIAVVNYQTYLRMVSSAMVKKNKTGIIQRAKKRRKPTPVTY